MVCNPCANRQHCNCLYPASCSCQHRVPVSCVDDVHQRPDDCPHDGACEVCDSPA